jgi:hypothetical protein
LYLFNCQVKFLFHFNNTSVCFSSAVAWCGKLNAIACASETCARIPRFAYFFHLLMPFKAIIERECARILMKI